jgi:ABC-type transport system involved in multi-copper enzyme maturation permease subunit
VGEIYRSTLVARGLRPFPLTLALALMGLMAYLASRERPGHLPADLLSIVYALVVGSGLVGMDVLNGSVHLLLTRAITRNGYLAGRFLGALTISGSVCLAMYGTAILTAAARGAGGELLSTLAGEAVSALAAVVWATSLTLLFSTALPERGDVLGYVGLMITAASIDAVARMSTQVVLVTIARYVVENLVNALPLSDWATHPGLVVDVLRFSSNVALVWTAAALAFHRREFSYAAG